MVDCEDVRASLDSRIEWLAAYTWYFQNVATGLCYAMVQHPHLSSGSPVPVPCFHLPFPDSISPDGLWRYEHHTAP
jgi:hypothetical protein